MRACKESIRTLHSPLPGTKVGPEPEQDAAMGCHLNIDVSQPLHPASGQLSAGEPCAMGQTDETVPQERIMRCQLHQKGCTRLARGVLQTAQLEPTAAAQTGIKPLMACTTV